MTEVGARPTSRAEFLSWLALVVLVGLNLRPFLTAVGPLTDRIAAGTGLDYGGLAALTLLPMLLMGLGAFFGTVLRQRLGTRRAVLGALTALALGSAFRALAPSGAALIATAALCGLGVAVIQAAFPGEIKRQFPHHVARVTGLYSASLMAGGALGAQFTPLLADASGNWRQALACWAAPVAMALGMAAWKLPANRVATRGSGPSPAMLKRPRTWLLMGCFGLVNGGYASLVAWLAPYYQAYGWTSAQSGSLVALMAIAQAAAALALPVLAKRRDRRPWLGLTLGAQAFGFAGLAFFPALAPQLWAGLLGAGLGGCFALVMIVALDHLPDPEEAGTLSALMQGGGFMLAATAPWVLAVLQSARGDFAIGWLVHLACVIGVLAMSRRLDPRHYAAAMAMLPERR